jgi:hypothetical protein
MTSPSNPVNFIDDKKAFEELCLALLSETVLGLDVETTLDADPDLCTIQFGNETTNWIIDVLAIKDISSVAPILLSNDIVKIIHYAPFEKKVFAGYGYTINNVFDTCSISRRLRRQSKGGHSLLAVCEREISVSLDKQWQTSDWTSRPLRTAQLNYAALDAEVLVKIYKIFEPLLAAQEGKPSSIAKKGASLWDDPIDAVPIEGASIRKIDVCRKSSTPGLNGDGSSIRNEFSGKRLFSGPSMPVSFYRGEVFACIRDFFLQNEKTSMEPLVQYLGERVTSLPLKGIESAVIRGFIKDAQSFGIILSDGSFLTPKILKLNEYTDDGLRECMVKLLERANAIEKSDATLLFLSELGLSDGKENVELVAKHVELLISDGTFQLKDDILSLRGR